MLVGSRGTGRGSTRVTTETQTGASGASNGATLAGLDDEARRGSIETFIDDFLRGARDGFDGDGDGSLILESLEASDLRARAEIELGVSPAIEDLLDQDSREGVIGVFLAAAEDGSPAPASGMARIEPDPDHRFDPFPLTEIQKAYLVGRSADVELGAVAGEGSVSTHVYLEFDVDDLDVERLQSALRALVKRHDMLRSVVREDGSQEVLRDVEPYEIAVADLRSMGEDEVEREISRIREELSHEVRPADTWPLFEVRAERLDDHRYRLHLSIDLLPIDGGSIQILLHEWSALYRDPDASLPEIDITFRDYALAIERLRESGAYDAAREYWVDRLDELPPAPDLPLSSPKRDEPVSKPRFRRRRQVLARDEWNAFKEAARARRLTPAGLLCASYAEVIGAWSKERRFTLNVTVGQRLPLHEHVDRLVGDFTSSVLLAVDNTDPDPFEQRATRIQRRLQADLENSLFGGVDVLRELARRGQAPSFGMPVVFTAMLGLGATDDEIEPFENYVEGVSQTPQVALDNQVVDLGGELNITWDSLEDAFPAGMVDAMFAAYCQLVRSLASADARTWGEGRPQLVPGDQLDLFRKVNETSRELQRGDALLHTLIDEHVEQRPGAPAVIAGERTLTYAELSGRANRVARRLREEGIGVNELVAVVMEKGPEQIVATLGVLRSGAAYLPIDAELPDRRVQHLLERGEARVVLTQEHVKGRFEWPDAAKVVVCDSYADCGSGSDEALDPIQGPDDLAYVIFTSGSTGTPSGVRIEHRAVVNTIADVIDRFRIGPDDRCLALSSLSFDLSVFDIFGILGSGGAIVVPDGGARRDPAQWAALVREHGVTVWNSVPALFEMLVDYAGGRSDVLGSSLRLALLSGDWIPLTLPEGARELLPEAELISLGGATEGSIWSIHFPIEDVDPNWPSIPYGRPMANQHIFVLDDELMPRPVWVPGEICIAGDGLSSGYWRDDEKTAERYPEDPWTGERIYRTGDLGRWLPDGNVEFLGRTDFQVKIRGYRVELAEIEAALLEHPAVEAAAVSAVGERSKRLVAYTVPTEGEAPADDDLRQFLDERLPEYMVPATYVSLDEMPLNVNGKVDISKLPDPGTGGTKNGRGAASGADHDRGEVAEKLREIWGDALGVDEVGYDDGFIDLGGDSLLAMRIVAKAGASGIRINPEDFLENPSLSDLLDRVAIQEESPYEQGLVADDFELTPAQRWFFEHDFDEMHHWNGMWPLLSVGEQLEPWLLAAALHRVMLHHDLLRGRFARTESGWRGRSEEGEGALPLPFSWIDLSEADSDEAERAVAEISRERQASLDIEAGPVLRLTYFDFGSERPGRLHMAAHWQTLDYYSSRVVFEDLQTVYFQLLRGEAPQLPPKTAPFREYSQGLIDRVREVDLERAAEPWLDERRSRVAPVPRDHDHGPNLQGSARRIIVSLGKEGTEALTDRLVPEQSCEVREAILTALGRAVAAWTGTTSSLWEVESHGRDDAPDGVDVSRTVGRCSTLTPVLIDVDPDADPRDELAQAMSQVRQCGAGGVSYGMLRYLAEGDVPERLAEMPVPELGFNYWGNVDEYFTELIWPSAESPGPHRSEAGHRPRLIDVLGFIASGELGLVWSYSANVHAATTVRKLAEATIAELHALVRGDDAEGEPPQVAIEIDEERGLEEDGGWRLPSSAEAAA
jgi:amino acid adenylation domain-containing protein/non-ribosomal peptide synthase protein (TIGR01720 family)